MIDPANWPGMSSEVAIRSQAVLTQAILTILLRESGQTGSAYRGGLGSPKHLHVGASGCESSESRLVVTAGSLEHGWSGTPAGGAKMGT